MVGEWEIKLKEKLNWKAKVGENDKGNGINGRKRIKETREKVFNGKMGIKVYF
jgi:hypothetical protein